MRVLACDETGLLKVVHAERQALEFKSRSQARDTAALCAALEHSSAAGARDDGSDSLLLGLQSGALVRMRLAAQGREPSAAEVVLREKAFAPKALRSLQSLAADAAQQR